MLTLIPDANPVYSEPVSQTPKIFEPFVNAPSLSKNVRNARHHVLANDVDGTNRGAKRNEWDITMKMNTDLIGYAVNKAKEWSLIKNPNLLDMTLAFQIFGQPALSRTNNHGGNPMGLGKSGPLLLCQLALNVDKTASPAVDEEFHKAGQQFVADLKAWGSAKGLDSPYIYMNYANQAQDVFAGYGKANQERMRKISKTNDPAGVFQKLMPGGKKLF
jgi:hypothetical protein